MATVWTNSQLNCKPQEDGTPDAFAYGNMVSLCIKAIQELSAQVTALQTQVAALTPKS